MLQTGTPPGGTTTTRTPSPSPFPELPGGRMAVLVEQDADRLTGLDQARLVDLATATQQLIAWAGAVQLEAIHELYRRRATPSPDVAAGQPSRALLDLVEALARRSTVAEIALATGSTEYTTAKKLSAANALHPRHPHITDPTTHPASDQPDDQPADHTGETGDPTGDPTGQDADIDQPPPHPQADREADREADPEAEAQGRARLFRTAAAYRDGLLDWLKVQAIVEATTGLPDPTARAVEAEAMTRLLQDHLDPDTGALTTRPVPGLTVPKLREILAAAVARHDPHAPEAAARAHRERRVLFTPGKDGMTELWALLPAIEAARAQALIRDLATTAATPDDDRTADQRRADTLLDLLTGRTTPPDTQDDTPTDSPTTAPGQAPGQASRRTPRQASRRTPRQVSRQAPRPQVIVMINWETFLGLNDDPGTLTGYGPVPAAMIRDLAAHGTWRCAVIDNQHSTLLGLGRTTYTPGYRPGPALTRHLTIRDRTCTFPGCRQPAHHCDLDHRTPHPTGDTCECNLAALCRHHHRLKHQAGFTATRPPTPDPPGTSPSGTSPPATSPSGTSPPGTTRSGTDASGSPTTVTWTTPAGRQYRIQQEPLTPAAVRPRDDIADDLPPF